MRSKVLLAVGVLAVFALLLSAAVVLAQPLYQEYAGRLGPGDSNYSMNTGKYFQTHEWFLRADQRHTIDLRSSDFDAYLILRDEWGREVARDDDSGGGLNARIVFTPTFAGRYFLEVTTYRMNETGVYRLIRMSEPMLSGETVVQGYLSPGRELWLRPGCYYQEHSFAFLPGRSYTIELNSDRGGSWFDPYLYLVDGMGQVVRSDDDSGGDLNARITGFVPSAGMNYRIIVSSFARGATGGYRLLIRW